MSELPDPPTAYICANEASALGAFSASTPAASVPRPRRRHQRDHDDLNVSQYFAPPITTYFLPIHEPSEMLGRYILRRIEGEEPQALQTLIMPKLIERSDDRLAR